MADTFGPPLVLVWTVAVCAFAVFWWGVPATFAGLVWLGAGLALGVFLYAPVVVALTVLRQWADAVAAGRARS